MRKTLISITIVSILVLASFLGFNYWKSTPEYSLLQIKAAIDTKDVYLFKKYVDLETIVERSVDVALERSLENMEEKKDENIFLDTSSFAKGLVKLMKPSIVNGLVNKVEKYVEGKENLNKRLVKNDRTITALQDLDLSSKRNMLNNGKKKYLKKDRKAARLGMEFQDKDGEIIQIELKLRKYEDYWRVTEIANLSELVDHFFPKELDSLFKPIQ
tara:strand:- start:251 stop:895 length:645 start_codon:yes stop_codon:yes gene_type:complete